MRVVGLVAACSAGCGDDDCCKATSDAALDAALDAASVGRAVVARLRNTPNRDVDLLFVIDDSPGMAVWQAALTGSFQRLITVLDGMEGGLPNLHIGVVSTDLGTKGALDAIAGPDLGAGAGSCSGNGKAGNLQTNATTLISGNFISDLRNSDGTRATNYTGPLNDAFSAVASLGATGCEFEQPLEAMKLALNNNPSNAGFVRESANLAVVFLTDEDDCSIAHATLLDTDTAALGSLQSFRCTRFGVTCDMGGTTSDEMNTPGSKTSCHSNDSSPYLTPVAGYAAFLNGLKADPWMTYVAAIASPEERVTVELRVPPEGGAAVPALAHACSSSSHVADPAVRILDLAGQSPSGAFVSTVCRTTYLDPLAELGREVRMMGGDPCLVVDIAMPADCEAVELTGTTTTMIPECTNGTAAPCFRLEEDPASCTQGQHLRVDVTRDAALAADAFVELRCTI